MRLIGRRCASLFCFLVGAWVPTGAWAGSSALGESGAVHALVVTSLGAIQPNVAADRAANPVLALETRAGGTVTRLLVPTTEDAAREAFQNLVFERSSASLFAVWQGFQGTHPVVYLAECHGGTWSSPIVVTQDASSPKYSPQLIVTRDTSNVAGAQMDRTILHVLYTQEPVEGSYETLYAPVVLHNGQYAGTHPTYRLNDFAVPGGASPGYPISRFLLRQPTLRHGLDDRSLVASFAHAASGRLLTVELGHLPIQLSRIAGDARSHIIITGVHGMGTQGAPVRLAFADETYANVHARAAALGFSADTAINLAEAARQAVLAEAGHDEPALQRTADEARAQIIATGARVRDHGLESPHLASAMVSWTPGDNSGDEDIHFELLADRVAPRSGGAVENRVYSSADGRRALVAWTDGQHFVRYRESETADVWSEVRELSLSTDLTLEMARQILDSKVD